MDVSVGQENSEPDTEGPPPAEVVYSQTEAAATSVMASEEPALPPVLEESNGERPPQTLRGIIFRQHWPDCSPQQHQ